MCMSLYPLEAIQHACRLDIALLLESLADMHWLCGMDSRPQKLLKANMHYLHPRLAVRLMSSCKSVLAEMPGALLCRETRDANVPGLPQQVRSMHSALQAAIQAAERGKGSASEVPEIGPFSLTQHNHNPSGRMRLASRIGAGQADQNAAHDPQVGILIIQLQILNDRFDPRCIIPIRTAEYLLKGVTICIKLTGARIQAAEGASSIYFGEIALILDSVACCQQTLKFLSVCRDSTRSLRQPQPVNLCLSAKEATRICCHQKRACWTGKFLHTLSLFRRCFAICESTNINAGIVCLQIL